MEHTQEMAENVLEILKKQNVLLRETLQKLKQLKHRDPNAIMREITQNFLQYYAIVDEIVQNLDPKPTHKRQKIAEVSPAHKRQKVAVISHTP